MRFKLLISILSCLLPGISALARELVIVDPTNAPITNVQCIGYDANRDSVVSLTTDEAGIVRISDETIRYILASRDGFNDRLYTLQDNNSDTLRLAPGEQLQELTVTDSNATVHPTYTSYRLRAKDMARYTTVLQSLNEIPNLIVLANGELFFEGNTNIALLIDGVDASENEVRTLSKEDISKVDVYTTPPLRFRSRGVSAVIDIRLKSELTGGNGAVDLNQAFYPLKGENEAALYYNYRRSRFMLHYTNTNHHYRKMRQNEELDYIFGGKQYLKKKEGLDSRQHEDDNGIQLRYQVNKPDNFLYNVQARGSTNRFNEHLNQKVHSYGSSSPATNYLSTRYNYYLVGNYFEKNFGQKFGKLLANVNYERYSTKYSSAYSESEPTSGVLSDSRSAYRINMDGVYAEIQYQLPEFSFGSFSLAAYNSYNHSRYADSTNPFFQKTNVGGLNVDYFGYKNRVSWFVILGFKHNYTFTSHLEKPYKYLSPNPMVQLEWMPKRNLRLTASYNYSRSNPGISQLSETDQWLDDRLVFHGNARLRPYDLHDINIRASVYSKYLNFTLSGRYNSSPHNICDMYTFTDRYVLQTLANLSHYRSVKGQLDVTIKPLGNSKWTIWNRVIWGRISGKNDEYSWVGHRFQWMTMMGLNLDHWTAQLFYQYPGKVSEGQLVRPRGECWSVTALYRPNTNLSLGIEWFMPFGKHFKEREYTTPSAPVYTNTETLLSEWANMVSFKLSYNFSFGRNRNSEAPEYDNRGFDSGILRK